METCKNVGVELWQARKARGLSRLQMVAMTKLRLGQLEAIESNDIAALPPPIFMRGHLRTYANELGLNPDDIVGRYLDQFKSKGTPAARTPEPRSRTSLTHPRVGFKTSFARVAMLALFVVVGLFFLNSPGARLWSAGASAEPTQVMTASPEGRRSAEPSPSFASVAARSRSIAYSTLGR